MLQYLSGLEDYSMCTVRLQTLPCRGFDCQVSGKTSLMRTIDKKIGNDDAIKTIWFIAWNPSSSVSHLNLTFSFCK